MTVNLLKDGMLAPSTLKSYRRSINLFKHFVETSHSQFEFPLKLREVMNFITYLHSRGYSHNTIASHLSALSFLCKITGSEDITNTFIVRKLQGAVKRKGVSVDSREPITYETLKRLIDVVDTSQAYENKIRKAMYLLAFHAFLRVGEFTLNSQTERKKIIEVNDIKILEDSDNTFYIELTLTQFKHYYNGPPFLILIHQAGNKKYCAVKAMAEYLGLRGFLSGPLFRSENKKAITRSMFASGLKKDLTLAGLSGKNIKTHSFRIGAATSASLRGISDSMIQKLGRWKTDAYQRYIRIPKHFTAKYN